MVTKTDYLLFRKHPCWMWLYKHDRSKLPKYDENLIQILEDGKDLERYAEALFPAGLHEPSDLVPETTHFQRRFSWGEFECVSDIVNVRPDGALVLIEVKQSTSVKDEHLHDLAFQKAVAEGEGYSVAVTAVLHVDNTYVREGEVDPTKLFKFEPVTDQVLALQGSTLEQMKLAAKVAVSPDMPDPSPRFCADTEAKNNWLHVLRTLREIPEASIYELGHLRLDQIAELEDMGILAIVDIPDDFMLRKDQSETRERLRRKEENIDTAKLREFISQIRYPIYFLDYESTRLPFPPFEKTKPHQQIVFQFSLHILDAAGASVEHREYIHTGDGLPAKEVVEELRKHIGPTGSVVVWNQVFEKTRHIEMASMLPGHANFLLGLNDRVVDLMVPFRNRHYYHPGFGNSYSIKKVLPVLAPELNYKELEVQEGESAQRLWRQAVIDGALDSPERERVLDALREYCKLDTYAMVAILLAVESAIA